MSKACYLGEGYDTLLLNQQCSYFEPCLKKDAVMKFRKRWYLWAIIFMLSALLISVVPTFWFNRQENVPVPLTRATRGPVTVPAAKTPIPTSTPTPIATPTANTASDTFITRSGTSLLLNGR